MGYTFHSKLIDLDLVQESKPLGEQRFLRSRSLRRMSNIACRTLHIGAAGIVLGGHFFGIEPARILAWTCLAVGTGAILTALEAWPEWHYVWEVRGAMVLGKILLMGTIPLFWDARAPILMAVVLIGSAGSHMPKRIRHFSLRAGHTRD
jgi:hypothetical protein